MIKTPLSHRQRYRETRAPLLPRNAPGWRTRAERFDMAVLEAYELIEHRWRQQVACLDIAVDEIPRISPKDPYAIRWPIEIVADGPIPLAHLINAGIDTRGNPTRARILLFRRPIEQRAKTPQELHELLREILVTQVATYLNVDPFIIDPSL